MHLDSGLGANPLFKRVMAKAIQRIAPAAARVVPATPSSRPLLFSRGGLFKRVTQRVVTRAAQTARPTTRPTAFKSPLARKKFAPIVHGQQKRQETPLEKQDRKADRAKRYAKATTRAERAEIEREVKQKDEEKKRNHKKRRKAQRRARVEKRKRVKAQKARIKAIEAREERKFQHALRRRVDIEQQKPGAKLSTRRMLAVMTPLERAERMARLKKVRARKRGGSFLRRRNRFFLRWIRKNKPELFERVTQNV